jgi:hypothetical protein
MTARDLTAWLAAYGRAWEMRDPEEAASLFAEAASYHETPFGPPARGRAGIRDYWAAATRGQRDVWFASDVVSAAGDRGVARWRAEFTRAATGARVKLDGIFVLEFDEAGLCTELREWWHRIEVPAEPSSPS